MKLLKSVNYGKDTELSFCNVPIFHSYSYNRDNANIKECFIFPVISLQEKLHKDLVEHFNSACDYIFVTSPGLGDNFFLAAYISQFKKSHRGTVGVLLREDRCLEMLQQFPAIDEIYVSREYFFRCFNSGVSTTNIKKNSVIKIHFPYNKDLYAPKCFGQHYGYLLGFDSNVNMDLPKLDSKYLELAQKEYVKEALDSSNTIIISPYSRFFDFTNCTADFWKKIADNLIKKGYSVVFNTKDKVYEDYKCIFPDNIMTFVGMIGLCNTFISMRAGINDIAGGFGFSNQIILYPANFALTNEPCFDKFRVIHSQLLKKYNKIPLEECLHNFYSLKTHFNIDCKEILLSENKDEILDELLRDL